MTHGQISRQEWSYSQTWRRCMHACLQARYRHDPMTRANHLWPAVPARQDCTDRLLFTSTRNNIKEEKKRLYGQSVSLRSSRVDRDSDREGKTASRSLARRSPSPLAPEIRARACLHSIPTALAARPVAVLATQCHAPRVASFWNPGSIARRRG